MVQRQNCDDNLHQCTGTEVCKNQHAVLDQNGEILIKRSIHAILSAMKNKTEQEGGSQPQYVGLDRAPRRIPIARFRIGDDGKSAYQRALG